LLRGRVALARSGDVGTVGVFGDAGWAGERDAFRQEDILYGVGVGGSVLDGLIRMDLSYGLDERARGLRLDLYLDAIL
jgi:outer membrane translocation and assembly module TamA